MRIELLENFVTPFGKQVSPLDGPLRFELTKRSILREGFEKGARFYWM